MKTKIDADASAPLVQRAQGMTWLQILGWILVAVAFISLGIVSTGCATQREYVRGEYNDFVKENEIGLVGGWRDNTLWGGIRVLPVGKPAEIKTLEASEPAK